MHRTGWIIAASIFAAATTLAADDLPEYESENTATSVRPVVNDVADGELLGSILREEMQELEPHSAADVEQLTGLESETLRVQGIVQSTYIPEGGGPVILNLGEDFRTCFKLVIESRNYDHWGLEAEAIAAIYDGQELLVEGTIALYNELPQIKVAAPSQIRRIVDE